MPLIAINLSEKLVKDIRLMVDNGRYSSMESFMEIGAFNQLALERGASPSEIIQKGHREVRGNDVQVATINSEKSLVRQAIKKTKKNGSIRKNVSKTQELLSVVTADESSRVFNSCKIDITQSVQPLLMSVSPFRGERIFGQVNRLFPLKFVCRWLLKEASEKGVWPNYSDIAAKLADDAGILGTLLDNWDKENIKDRGGELATALPRRNNNASNDRFLSQFVARITRSSEITPGAICQYELANFNDSRLMLTEQGVAFANFQNSILDGQDKATVTALSEDETIFLCEHIKKHVPTEWSDMKTVLDAVINGKTSPTEVAEAVRVELPPEWSESMIHTHVSGVIARLSEIRLLARSWHGRNVRYELVGSDHVSNLLTT